MRLAALGVLVLRIDAAAARRAVYLIVTLGVAVAVSLLLAALAAPTTRGTPGADFGVMIRNDNQGAPALPLRYAERMVRAPGATDVAWTTLQMVTCGARATLVTINAYGGPGAARTLATAAHVDAGTMRRWESDPLGLIITDRAAEDCGWRVGEGVNPAAAAGTRFAFHISGIVRAGRDSIGDVAFAHFDYINRAGSLMGADQVVQYTAYAADPRNNDLLAARIMQEFAHDFPAVNAVTSTTAQSAWLRFGKIQEVLMLVMVAVFLCAASVFVSVFAHSAAERRPRFALLQVIGFGRGALLAAFALEALAIVALGTALGIGLGSVLQHLLARNAHLAFMTAGFNTPTWAYAWLAVSLALLLATSLVWPASLIRCVRPVDVNAN